MSEALTSAAASNVAVRGGSGSAYRDEEDLDSPSLNLRG